MTLPILYQDDSLVVIDKPANLLVHRSLIDKYETQFAVQILRDQIQKKVFSVHRLDKPTSGILIFALNSEVAKALSESFLNRKVKKEYKALVRGFSPESHVIDYPLKEEKDPLSDSKANKNRESQEAITRIQTLEKYEVPWLIDKYPTSRYSLVQAQPLTGRKHQIRRHLRHMNHPIIGDVEHGQSKHNRFFEKQYSKRQLLLHCTKIEFEHPVTSKNIILKCELNSHFSLVINDLRKYQI